MSNLATVNLDRFIGARPWGALTPADMLDPAAVIGALDTAWREGSRVAFLGVASPGGNCAESFALIERLEEWRKAGGQVIAWVADARSTATAIALAADVVVIDPAGSFVVHSMLGGSPEAVGAWNRRMLAKYEERTATPTADLAAWLALCDGTPGANFAELDADAALSHGWADCVGGEADARQIAEALALGAALPITPRAVALATRRACAPPSPAPEAPDAGGQLAPTVGVKLDHSGTALKIAAQNVQVGAWTLERLFAALAASNYVPFALPSASAWKRFKEITLAGATQGRIFALSTSTAAATSDNGGRTWTARTMPAGTWAGCAYSPSLGLFVAVGTSVAASSPDGITWTARTIPAGTYNDVTWDPSNGRFVAVGSAGVCATSTNGTSWTARTLPAGDYYGVAWNGTIYAAVGINGTNPVAASSTDSVTWTARTIPGAGTSRAYAAIAVGAGGLFLAVGGYSGVVTICATSPDGITWTDRSGVVPSGISYQAVAYGNGIFVAAGQDALFRDRVSMTPDGVNWKTASPCLNSKLFAVEYLSGFLGQRNAFIVGGLALSGVASDPAGGTSLNMAP